MAEFEIVIRGGSVVDGTGIPSYTADVGIAGGRIREIGRIAAARGARVIDTLVGGEVTFEGDRCTGATPGRLLRHGRAA